MASISSQSTVRAPLPPGFPSLIPAFTFQFRIGPPALVGGLSLGRPLTVVPIISGTVRTESSWNDGESEDDAEGGIDDKNEVKGRRPRRPRLTGTLRGQGVDYVRNDPDGKRMRLEAGVVVE
jgi:hypothetical protein